MFIGATLLVVQPYLLGTVAGRQTLAAISGLAAAAIFRVIEGGYDARRQTRGDVRRGDVRAEKG